MLDDDSPLNLLYGSGRRLLDGADLARYDRALFGNQLLRPALLAEMFEPRSWKTAAHPLRLRLVR